MTLRVDRMKQQNWHRSTDLHTNKSVKTTYFREVSRPKQNAVTRGRTKALGDTKGIDLGILTIQRRKRIPEKIETKSLEQEAGGGSISTSLVQTRFKSICTG
ncbi:uncharacterized protein EAF02_010308 [Botrytis sinoallii]|uniref:uncharacterized protein n=1 Tax=Botrytis sinoallii TaxID=1463999 RepID=UPI001901C1B4|nr:uncharacterized protein EAF02_010308 [Botrytis sinoallii]KAF7864340.1 hypothetical protein EAF02_010308 [Botrytis sinoallii]